MLVAVVPWLVTFSMGRPVNFSRPALFSDEDGERMSTIEERRARKAERRIEQRRITILRAGKMHNARMLAEAAGTAPATSDPPPVNIGCSGWFYWHLKGSFYPSQMTT